MSLISAVSTKNFMNVRPCSSCLRGLALVCYTGDLVMFRFATSATAWQSVGKPGCDAKGA